MRERSQGPLALARGDLAGLNEVVEPVDVSIGDGLVCRCVTEEHADLIPRQIVDRGELANICEAGLCQDVLQLGR